MTILRKVGTEFCQRRLGNMGYRKTTTPMITPDAQTIGHTMTLMKFDEKKKMTWCNRHVELSGLLELRAD